MTTHDLPVGTAAAATRPSAWRTGLTAAVVASFADLLVYVLGRLAGADFSVATPGRAPLEIGPLMVAANVVGATALGTLLLAAVGRGGARAWRIMGWVGLSFGVLSMLAPLGATGSIGARLLLAAMHLVTGIVWYSVVTRNVRELSS